MGARLSTAGSATSCCRLGAGLVGSAPIPPISVRGLMSVRKAVITAAGFGTRLLPATKAQPKEMLPVVDRPAIQYLVDEAGRAGIEDIVIVTAMGKRSIEDHFDRNFELESFLERGGKFDQLKEIVAISEQADIHYVRQKEQLGLGHAVLTARRHVGDEPFVVMLADEIIWPDPLLERMLDVHQRLGRSVIAVMEVGDAEVPLKGIVDPGPREGDLVRVQGIVEKPPLAEAPSRLAAIGRYVFTPDIFDLLESQTPGTGGEIQLTDAIARQAADEAVYALVHEGRRFDVGEKVEFIRANIEMALYRDDLAPEVRQMLREIATRHALF